VLSVTIKKLLDRSILLSLLIPGIGLTGCHANAAEQFELTVETAEPLTLSTKTPEQSVEPTKDIEAETEVAEPEPAADEQNVLDQTGTLWYPYLEWSLVNPSYSGDPFDLIATVTFTHQETNQTHQTQMYYDGNDTWKFRFTATRTGIWTFTTTSNDSDLNGHGGTITIDPNPNPNAKGFLLPAGNKFARQIGNNGELEAFLFNLYQDNLAFPADFWDWQNDVSLDYIRTYPAEAWATEYLQKARDHGSDVLFIALANQWLQAGALRYNQHDSEHPDLLTFEMLERVITTAHEQGGHLHIWAWGDEQRQWTPIGLPGGINGEVDRRLQRYIAARLGPLPGWSMSYGFDLHEWVSSSQVETWGTYMYLHLGWPILLAARTEASFFSPDNLNVFSIDARPSVNFYDMAIMNLEFASGRPVLFERRFYYGRDDVWTMEATRRAMWQFTIAGGVGSLWGLHHTLGAGPYPNSNQMSTHRQFWQGRFLLDMAPANELTDGYALKVHSNSCYVFYKEDAASIHLNLSNMVGSQPAVAIDTKQAYAEIDLGTLSPVNQTWNAPYQSDWVIAVGDFNNRSATTFDVHSEQLNQANDLDIYMPLIAVSVSEATCRY
jgi:hypothetical protein